MRVCLSKFLLPVNRFDFRALGAVMKSGISKIWHRRIPRTELCFPKSRSPLVTIPQGKAASWNLDRTTCSMCDQWKGVTACISPKGSRKVLKGRTHFVIHSSTDWSHRKPFSLNHLWGKPQFSLQNYKRSHWFLLYYYKEVKGVLPINLLTIMSQFPNISMKMSADISHSLT